VPLIRPTRNVRDTWLSQRWREISGGFPAKLTLSSRAAFGGNRPRPYPIRSKRREPRARQRSRSGRLPTRLRQIRRRRGCGRGRRVWARVGNRRSARRRSRSVGPGRGRLFSATSGLVGANVWPASPGARAFPCVPVAHARALQGPPAAPERHAVGVGARAGRWPGRPSARPTPPAAPQVEREDAHAAGNVHAPGQPSGVLFQLEELHPPLFAKIEEPELGWHEGGLVKRRALHRSQSADGANAGCGIAPDLVAGERLPAVHSTVRLSSCAHTTTSILASPSSA
jgi:hypothetical protein